MASYGERLTGREEESWRDNAVFGVGFHLTCPDGSLIRFLSDFYVHMSCKFTSHLGIKERDWVQENRCGSHQYVGGNEGKSG